MRESRGALRSALSGRRILAESGPQVPSFSLKAWANRRTSAKAEIGGYAGVIQANNIAVRILQVGLPPKPDLVLGCLVEFDSQLAQPLEGGIQIVALEIDHGLRRATAYRMHAAKMSRRSGIQIWRSAAER